MKTLRAAVLLAAFALLAAPAFADQGYPLVNRETKEDFGRLTVGFDGHVSRYLPVPLTVQLKNPYKEQQTFKLRLLTEAGRGSSSRSFEREVLLDAGAEKVLRLNFRFHQQVKVKLTADGDRVFSGEFSVTNFDDFRRRILIINGAESRIGSEDFESGQNTFIGQIDERAMPVHSVCYHLFSIVIVRFTDPQSWSAEQREALELYLRLGGTVIFVAKDDQTLGVETLWKTFSGEVSEQQVYLNNKLSFRWKRRGHGVGAAYLTSADIVKDHLLLPALNRRQLTGRLVSVLQAPSEPIFPRHFTQNNRESGPAFGFTLMIGFFLIYTLTLGPVVALSFRKRSRYHMARAIFVVIISAIILAPVIAFLVRQSPASLRVYSLIEFDEGDRPLQTSEVHLISGGGRGYSARLRGGDDFVAFMPKSVEERESDYVYYGNWNSRPSPSLRSSHYDYRKATQGKLEIDSLPIEAWSSYSFFSVQTPKLTPLTARVRFLGANSRSSVVRYQVDITNTSPYTIHNLVFGGRIANSPRNIKLTKRLASGASLSKEVELQQFVSLNSSLQVDDGDSGWRHWTRLPKDKSAWLAGVIDDPTLDIEGSGLEDFGHRTVWIQGINVEGERATSALPNAFIGITLRPNSEQERYIDGVEVTAVEPNSPAERGGLRVDDRLVIFNGQSISEPADMIRALRRCKPGQRVQVQVNRSQQYGNYQSLVVKLGRRPR